MCTQFQSKMTFSALLILSAFLFYPQSFTGHFGPAWFWILSDRCDFYRICPVDRRTFGNTAYGKYRVSLKPNSSGLVCCREMNYTSFKRRHFKLFNDIKTLPRSYSQIHLLYTTKWRFYEKKVHAFEKVHQKYADITPCTPFPRAVQKFWDKCPSD